MCTLAGACIAGWSVLCDARRRPPSPPCCSCRSTPCPGRRLTVHVHASGSCHMARKLLGSMARTDERGLQVTLRVHSIGADGVEVADGADAGLAVQEVEHLDVQAGQGGAHRVVVVPGPKLPPVSCAQTRTASAPAAALTHAGEHGQPQLASEMHRQEAMYHVAKCYPTKSMQTQDQSTKTG